MHRLSLQRLFSILRSSNLPQARSEQPGEPSHAWLLLIQGLNVQLLHDLQVLQCAWLCRQGPRLERSNQGLVPLCQRALRTMQSTVGHNMKT